MIEPEVLYDKLASLQHPDDIAEFCRQEGITGIVSEDTSCVLAQLFKRECGVQAVKVGGECIEWSKTWPEYDWWDGSGWGEQRRHSFAMEGFIRRFDHNDYPDLVTPAEVYD